MIAALEAAAEGVPLEQKAQELPELRTALEMWNVNAPPANHAPFSCSRSFGRGPALYEGSVASQTAGSEASNPRTSLKLALPDIAVGCGHCVIGYARFLLAFLTRTALTQQGIAWRDIQFYALLTAFLGGLLFALSAAHFKIELSGLTFDRLLAILRNEVYVPPDKSHTWRAA